MLNNQYLDSYFNFNQTNNNKINVCKGKANKTENSMFMLTQINRKVIIRFKEENNHRS